MRYSEDMKTLKQVEREFHKIEDNLVKYIYDKKEEDKH
jgi:hypothetical protein